MRNQVTRGHAEPDPIPGKKFLEVGDGHFATIDETDYDQLKVYTWSLNENGEPRTSLPHIDGGHKCFLLKNMILETKPTKGYCVKYLDGDALNNCRSNIRWMTLKEGRALDRQILGPLIRAPRTKNPRNIKKMLLL